MYELKSIIDTLEKNKDRKNITSTLTRLLNEINTIIREIKKCKNVSDAISYFELLEETNSCISGLIFLENIKVGKELWKFFKDFDRIDDIRCQTYMFDKIKNKNYSLDQESDE